MRAKQEVGIYANAAKSWSVASRSRVNRVLLISPYITSTIAQTIARQNRAAIYTLFDAELFARGASSLSSLERLLRAGNDLFFLPNLHAKVMLFGDERATVGSQNLTRRGTLSREATAAFTDERVVARIHSLVKPWLEEAEPITLSMIAAMKKSLPALKRAFGKINDEAKATTTRIVDEAIAARTREKDVVRRIRTALSRYPRPATSVLSSVRELRSGRNSLVPESPLDAFTWWQIEGREVRLARKDRYLCLNEQTGMIGWGRVMKRRISFIEDDFIDEFVFDDRRRKLEVQAEWEPEKLSAGNLSIRVKTSWDTPICDLKCSFEVDRLRILTVTDASNGINTDAVDSFSRQKNDLESALLPILLKPFRYNRALSGSRPEKFVGPPGTMVTVEVVQLADYEILLFRTS